MLQVSAMEGSKTSLEETVMAPPSTQRGVKRKSKDMEPALPVSGHPASSLSVALQWRPTIQPASDATYCAVSE